MYVIVTCKYEKDLIKNSREKKATPFPFYSSILINYSKICMGIKFVFVNLRAYNLVLTIFFVLVLSFMKLVGSIFYKSEKIIIASNYLTSKVKYRNNKIILTHN